MTKENDENLVVEQGCSKGNNSIVPATPRVDVFIMDHPSLRDLSRLQLRNPPKATLIVKSNIMPCGSDFRNFDPKVDKIRVAQGDFTIQEILDHGHDAPFYKQARITAEVLKGEQAKQSGKGK